MNTRNSKAVCMGLSLACAGALCLPVLAPHAAVAKTIKADGTYSVTSAKYLPGNSQVVKKFKLTKKKLTIKGVLFKGPNRKKVKGRSFTFKVSPKLEIGEYADGKYRKYKGSQKKRIVKDMNRCSFPSITFKVRKGEIVKLYDHS